jgi:threonine dehydrogenase-like Zn-dependent dehydrogenase
MKAIVLRQISGTNDKLIALADVPKPRIDDAADVLIKVLAVGLDGTDKEIIEEQYGVLPAHAEQMVIGHELLGVIEEAGPQSGFAIGDLATVLVRRPCGMPECIHCREGQQDFCSTGRYTERGIREADGFMSEYVVENARYVVRVPANCKPYGVLVEPQSVVEKICRQAAVIQERLLWKPQTALVIGSGPLGLLAALTCRTMGLDVHVWSKSPDDSVNAEIVRRCGVHYHYADETRAAGNGAFASGLTETAAEWGRGIDWIWECSGHSPLVLEAMTILNPNGLLALLGVTPGHSVIEAPSDWLNREMVLKNKCVIGSVNSSRADFEAAVVRLQGIERQFPGELVRIMTDELAIEQVPGIDFHRIAVKAVVRL